MSEIVDRVAEAIAVSAIRSYIIKLTKGDADDLARAAIKAMRDLPEEPGPRYTAGEYSRRNIEAMIDDALIATSPNTTNAETTSESPAQTSNSPQQ